MLQTPSGFGLFCLNKLILSFLNEGLQKQRHRTIFQISLIVGCVGVFSLVTAETGSTLGSIDQLMTQKPKHDMPSASILMFG